MKEGFPTGNIYEENLENHSIFSIRNSHTPPDYSKFLTAMYGNMRKIFLLSFFLESRQWSGAHSPKQNDNDEIYVQPALSPLL